MQLIGITEHTYGLDGSTVSTLIGLYSNEENAKEQYELLKHFNKHPNVVVYEMHDIDNDLLRGGFHAQL